MRRYCGLCGIQMTIKYVIVLHNINFFLLKYGESGGCPPGSYQGPDPGVGAAHKLGLQPSHQSRRQGEGLQQGPGGAQGGDQGK